MTTETTEYEQEICVQVNGCVSVRVCERKKKNERKRLWRQSRSGTLNYAKRIAFFMFIVSHFTFNFFYTHLLLIHIPAFACRYVLLVCDRNV